MWIRLYLPNVCILFQICSTCHWRPLIAFNPRGLLELKLLLNTHLNLKRTNVERWPEQQSEASSPLHMWPSERKPASLMPKCVAIVVVLLSNALTVVCPEVRLDWHCYMLCSQDMQILLLGSHLCLAVAPHHLVIVESRSRATLSHDRRASVRKIDIYHLTVNHIDSNGDAEGKVSSILSFSVCISALRKTKERNSVF